MAGFREGLIHHNDAGKPDADGGVLFEKLGFQGTHKFDHFGIFRDRIFAGQFDIDINAAHMRLRGYQAIHQHRFIQRNFAYAQQVVFVEAFETIG